MAIQFRRSALCAGIAALFVSFTAQAADIPQKKSPSTINSASDDHHRITVVAKRSGYPEPEGAGVGNLKALMVAEERENIARGSARR